MNTPDIVEFNSALKIWFETNKRDFPWRNTRDPYHVLVSEIMSHQTQITRVATNFFPRFIDRFPDINVLASASDWEEIFPYWEGLGYYARGKNLWKAARILRDKYKGIFPQEIEELQKIPGIGPYTASAIATFAFGQKCPAFDTNLRKVLSYLYSPETAFVQAEELVSASWDGGEWNSAMMDLASALRAGIVIDGDLGKFFPPESWEKFKPQRRQKVTVKKTKPTTKKQIEVGIACIHQNGRYLIQTRPKGKSFAGKWEFPGGKRENGETIRDCVKREVLEEIGVKVSVRPAFFSQTHKFKDAHLILRFHRCQIQTGVPHAKENQKIDWAAPADFESIDFLDTNQRALFKLAQIRL